MARSSFVKGLLGIALSTLTLGAFASHLKVVVYNPGEKSLFPVSSELVLGKNDAVLVDAQFEGKDAKALLKKIKDSGKKLTTVYISHSDPDFYFGLDVIKEAYPDAKVVASPQTVAAIKETMDGKLAYWKPILKDNAPKKLILPEALTGDSITLEGEKIEVIGLKGPDPKHTFVWIPSIKTVLGGVIVYGNMHLWVADNQTKESREHWFKLIDMLEELKPKTVIPSHFLGNAPKTLASVKFTKEYLKKFESEAEKAKNSAELIASMKKLYPKLGGKTELEMSAKVIKGEMKWPQ